MKRKKYVEISHMTPIPHICIAFPIIIATLHERGTFVAINEPTLIHHYHQSPWSLHLDSLFKKKKTTISFFLTALDLQWELLFVGVQGIPLPCLLLLWSHGHSAHGLQQLWNMVLVAACLCNLPRLEIKPVSPALAGEFLTTGPPEKSPRTHSWCCSFYGFGQIYHHSCIQSSFTGLKSSVLCLITLPFPNMLLWTYVWRVLCRDTCFQLLWLNTKEHDSWKLW